jgi:quercetin dioxygenase-like cupin family protein
VTKAFLLDVRRKTQRRHLDFRNFSDREARRAALPLPSSAADPMPSTPASIRHLRWNDIPKESVTTQLSRRLVTGDRMMLAQVYLDKGCLVPRHSHENEQITWIVEGALKFWIGADGEEEVIVRAGEVLHIPSNVPHQAEALEDTLDVDIFSPIRQDWLDHTDGYFHATGKK